MLRHIAQRRPLDCAVASAAMAANVPYEEAAALSPDVTGTCGLAVGEVHPLLEAVTGVRWHGPEFGWFRRVGRLPGTEQPLVVITRRPWHLWALHCVVLAGRWVHDPWFWRGYLQSDYPLRHWRVEWIFRAAAPELLGVARRSRKQPVALIRPGCSPC
jgi:hypothetical protein